MDESLGKLDTVERHGKQIKAIKEGKATILLTQDASANKSDSELQQVFYNPIQQYNRDLSVLVIKTFGERTLERRIEQFSGKPTKNGKKRKRGDEAEVEAEAKAQQVDMDTMQVEPQPAQPETRQPEKPTAIQEPPTESRPTFKILDALAASGLRALRYGQEVPFVTSIVANDLSSSAAKSIKENVEYNGLEHKISVSNDDALAHMYRGIAEDLSKRDRYGNPGKAHKYDVIDLDPYGTAAPFLDAAVQAVRDDGGLLAITCTDSAVWAGHSYSEKSFSLYGGAPVKGTHCHEVGLRLILNAVASSAARYGLYMEPLLSLSIDFYAKVFVRISKSPKAVKFLGAKTILAYTCDVGCGAWQVQPLLRSRLAPNKKGSGTFYKHGFAQAPGVDRHCPHCGTKMHLTGPMYGGLIHSQEFIQQVLNQLPSQDPEVYGTLPRIEGMLRLALEEQLIDPEPEGNTINSDSQYAVIDDHPFYVFPQKLAGVMGAITPPDDLFRGALMHLGYRVTRSHCKGGSVKTDAPWPTIWWIMTQWIRQRAPIKEEKIKIGSMVWRLLTNSGYFQQKDPSLASAELSEMQTDAMTETSVLQEDASAAANKAQKAFGITGESGEIPVGELELRKTLVFDSDLARLGRNPKREGVRYQINPREHWGPLSKAKKH